MQKLMQLLLFINNTIKHKHSGYSGMTITSSIGTLSTGDSIRNHRVQDWAKIFPQESLPKGKTDESSTLNNLPY